MTRSLRTRWPPPGPAGRTAGPGPEATHRERRLRVAEVVEQVVAVAEVLGGEGEGVEVVADAEAVGDGAAGGDGAEGGEASADERGAITRGGRLGYEQHRQQRRSGSVGGGASHVS